MEGGVASTSTDEQQKRGGFVHVGDLALDLTVSARRPARHFTQLDQVNQLVEAGEAEPDIGFMARLLALCSLPRSNPGDRLQFTRVNGPYTLGMVAGLGNKLPYGNIPRLLLAWVCTEAARTQSRELVLGDSLSDFMRRLGIYSTSGDKHTRLRNQMTRLFRCQIELIYQDEHGERSVASRIADSTESWWNPKRPDQPATRHRRGRTGSGGGILGKRRAIRIRTQRRTLRSRNDVARR